jgi:hypothetical protein
LLLQSRTANVRCWHVKSLSCLANRIAVNFSVSWVGSCPSVSAAASARPVWPCLKEQEKASPVHQDWPSKQGSRDYANGILRTIRSHDYIAVGMIPRPVQCDPYTVLTGPAPGENAFPSSPPPYLPVPIGDQMIGGPNGSGRNR